MYGLAKMVIHKDKRINETHNVSHIIFLDVGQPTNGICKNKVHEINEIEYQLEEEKKNPHIKTQFQNFYLKFALKQKSPRKSQESINSSTKKVLQSTGI